MGKEFCVHSPCLTILFVCLFQSGVLPQDVDRSQWSDILALVKVMATVHTTCVSSVVRR